MAVVDGCPAFQGGCPFSKMEVNLLPASMESLPDGITDKWINDKCPAFKEGCPFKTTDSVEMLYNVLSEMPESHQVHQDSLAAKVVGETLRLVHTKSVALKSDYNAACPVFATSCPFKTVTTYGVPLVSELDVVVERWGLQNPPSPDGTFETVNEAAEPLSKHLKAGTKIVHRSAENVHFVRDFLKGSVAKESYIDLLRALYHVYNAIEVALDGLPESLRHCDFAALRRADALLSDLRYYTGTPASETLDLGPMSPAAQQYVDRIHKLAKDDPHLVLAHAYTRYLGDLSGGQILAKAAGKAYNLPEGQGAAFYKFENVGVRPADLKAFKKAYRSSLDALQVSTTQADDIVHEANMAFLLNILIFEERDVAAGHLDRIRTLEEVNELVESNKSPLAFQKAYIAAGAQSSDQCPFIPGPAGRRANGEPSFHATEGGVCPWPFVWFHNPKSAIVTHPLKNGLGLIGMIGIFRVALQYPRRSLMTFACTTLAAIMFKPTKKDDTKQ